MFQGAQTPQQDSIVSKRQNPQIVGISIFLDLHTDAGGGVGTSTRACSCACSTPSYQLASSTRCSALPGDPHPLHHDHCPPHHCPPHHCPPHLPPFHPPSPHPHLIIVLLLLCLLHLHLYLSLSSSSPLLFQPVVMTLNFHHWTNISQATNKKKGKGIPAICLTKSAVHFKDTIGFVFFC